ncbi:MAG TPA: hypothetical protein VFO79_07205 [Xanthomonadales bacterium]|nr:hypothetical protein [Xanthomonadales bacterium]
MRIALLLLFACGGSQRPEPCAESTWVLARLATECADLRSGSSGYHELQIVDGPLITTTVVAYYGDGQPARVGNWNVARARFAPTTMAPGRDNPCTTRDPTRIYAGVVAEVIAFEHEAQARDAFAAKRCAR